MLYLAADLQLNDVDSLTTGYKVIDRHGLAVYPQDRKWG